MSLRKILMKPVRYTKIVIFNKFKKNSNEIRAMHELYT